MTVKEMRLMIGRRALLRSAAEPLSFPVKIRDAKNAYGNLRFLVAPIRGEGETWVDSGRVTIPPKVPAGSIDGDAPK